MTMKGLPVVQAISFAFAYCSFACIITPSSAFVPNTNFGNHNLDAVATIRKNHHDDRTSSSSRQRSTVPLNASVRAAFGMSNQESTWFSVQDAVHAAKDKLGLEEGETASLAIVSCTAARDPAQVQRDLKTCLSGVPIHGITSNVNVLTSDGSVENAIGVLLLKSDDKDSFATGYDASDGAAAAKALKERMPNPKAIFMSATPGAEEGVIEAIDEIFPDVPVVGGTAADNDLSGKWVVMSDSEASGTGVSLVGISESVPFAASMTGPYTLTEKCAKATKTDGRRVYEIDGIPAADWALDWLGDDVKEQYDNGGLVLPQTAQKPIGIQQPSKQGLGKKILSKIPGFRNKYKDEYEHVTAHLAAFGGGENKFIDFFAPVPEGSVLTVMDSGDGPSTGYAAAMGDAFEAAKSDLGDKDPSAAILVFCGGMGIAVGDNLDDGLTSLSSKVKDIPMMGMTCFGEQGQLEHSRKNVQRNLSVGFVLLG